MSQTHAGDTNGSPADPDGAPAEGSINVGDVSGGKIIGTGLTGAGNLAAETMTIHGNVIIVGSTGAGETRPAARPRTASAAGKGSVQAVGAMKVFFSYAREDQAHHDALAKHLKLLQRTGLIEGWHDRMIAPGEEREAAIDEQLETADVVLMLVSNDFLASDHIWEREMTRALERHDAGEARVIPVFVRECDWRGAPFARLQGLPRNARPVTSWENQDEAWAEVAEGIRSVVQKR